jgi:hypothetical protein
VTYLGNNLSGLCSRNIRSNVSRGTSRTEVFRSFFLVLANECLLSFHSTLSNTCSARFLLNNLRIQNGLEL